MSNTLLERIQTLKKRATRFEKEYPAVNINPNAVIRNNIIKHIGDATKCRVETSNLYQFFADAEDNDEINRPISKNWLRANKKYVVSVKDGKKRYYRLTPLGKKLYKELYGVNPATVLPDATGLSECKVVFWVNEEKAASKSQQRLFGMAYAIKTGEMELSDVEDKDLRKKLKGMVDGMTKDQLKDKASTSHDDLPETVDEEGEATPSSVPGAGDPSPVSAHVFSTGFIGNELEKIRKTLRGEK